MVRAGCAWATICALAGTIINSPTTTLKYGARRSSLIKTLDPQPSLSMHGNAVRSKLLLENELHMLSGTHVDRIGPLARA